ncbi:uncharacterized protein EI90DRAFT_3089347 [Cantharellus anzutake]|uniref:uncharacterized protein n=1 Tax=Cantharellus anzutake TaxID=1750568 RepID=UPI001902DAC9|nr:uncharacterized protein EI90DRAFT_3089347 [Cantharellus anzutake]KAF8314859.1 hypothetical protein EI90DRAFT_3089347 [Cantharellus anzutake]
MTWIILIWLWHGLVQITMDYRTQGSNSWSTSSGSTSKLKRLGSSTTPQPKLETFTLDTVQEWASADDFDKRYGYVQKTPEVLGEAGMKYVLLSLWRHHTSNEAKARRAANSAASKISKLHMGDYPMPPPPSRVGHSIYAQTIFTRAPHKGREFLSLV